MLEWLLNIDREIFLAINGWNSPFFDKVMFFISGKISWLPLFLVFLWFIIKSYKKKAWLMLLMAAFVIFMSDQTSVHLFKNVFQRLRPCHDPALEGLVHIVNGKCGGLYAFISSHATNVFAMGTFLTILLPHYRKWMIPLTLVWTLTVIYSRVYLGVHYPLDVIAGSIWGAFLGWILARFTQGLVGIKNDE
jgi:undecaprenyl-diphosphatase